MTHETLNKAANLSYEIGRIKNFFHVSGNDSVNLHWLTDDQKNQIIMIHTEALQARIDLLESEIAAL